jgi:hypothetical protein
MIDINKFSIDKKVNSTFTITSSQRMTSLKDIRVYGHFRFPWYGKIFQLNPSGTELQFSNNEEEAAYKKGKVPEDQMWKYHINEYNFRDTWDLSSTNKIKIACFGDSFTFGDGVESSGTYPRYLERMLDARVFNVGKGGSGIERVARTFSAFVKFVDIDVAVFTLPHMYRELFIDPQGILVDLIPNVDEHQQHFKYMQPFFGLHENYQLTKLSLLINYIMDIAELKKIKVLITSWDIPTHNLLSNLVPNNLMSQIFPNNIDVRGARDLGHPGKGAHENHAENIVRELNDRAWI